MTENEIHQICKEYNITNYTINSDMSVDVNYDVRLHKKGLKKFPLNFNKVYGTFDCGSNNNLTSLKGCPKYVIGNFYCDDNELESLKYAPEYIGGSFRCDSNKLNTLQYCPKYIGENFYFFVNNIRDFTYFPKIKGEIDLYNNPIEEIWNLFKNKDYIEYFNELDIIQQDGEVVILDRLNYFLTDIGKEEVKKDDIKKYIVK